MNSIMKCIATMGFIGYMPVAPGTFGSLAAMLMMLFLNLSPVNHILLALAVTALGTVASHRSEKALGEKDSRHIVIDEFAGYIITVLFLPATIAYLSGAFFLFRFFDILKPPPIRSLETLLPGGWGIMADDLLAGIYANVLLQVWKLLIAP